MAQLAREPLAEIPTTVERSHVQVVQATREDLGHLLVFPGAKERELENAPTRVARQPEAFTIGQITIQKAQHELSREKEFIDACIRTKDVIRRMLQLKQIQDGPFTIVLSDKYVAPEEGAHGIFPGIVIDVQGDPLQIRQFINKHCAESARLQLLAQKVTEPNVIGTQPEQSSERAVA